MAKKIIAVKASTKPIVHIMSGEAKWEKELTLLYDIVRATELDESIKWGGPSFTYDGKLVLGIGGFKSYVGIWFNQGVFLKDRLNVLVNASEGKTKALRQWRFQSIKEMNPKHIKEYVLEAIENAKEGKSHKLEKKEPIALPAELKKLLTKDKKLKSNFAALSPFKQREFLEYISDAKQEKTRIARVEKSVPLILAGIGLNDMYR